VQHCFGVATATVDIVDKDEGIVEEGIIW